MGQRRIQFTYNNISDFEKNSTESDLEAVKKVKKWLDSEENLKFQDKKGASLVKLSQAETSLRNFVG